MGRVICEQIVQHNHGSTRTHTPEKFKFAGMAATLGISAAYLYPYAAETGGELPCIFTATMELTLDSTVYIDAIVTVRVSDYGTIIVRLSQRL